MAKEKKIGLDEMISQMNKDYGDGSIMKFSDKSSGKYNYISTDSFAFDFILGGGIALGKMYELVGWEGSGKSTICAHIAKNAQIKFPDRKVLYIDSENALDIAYFSAIGVDIDSMLVGQVRSAEQGFAMTEKLISTGAISLCIIDSDTAMQPQAIIEGEMGELRIGLKARLNGQAYPRLHKIISSTGTALIIVSQYREKIGVMYGPNTTTNGGHAVKYTADCRIEVSKTLNREGDIVPNSIVTVKAIKNRLAAPFRKATFDVIFGIGIDRIKDLLEQAIELGVVNKAAAGWCSYKDTKIQGVDAFSKLIEDNEELRSELEEEVRKKME